MPSRSSPGRSRPPSVEQGWRCQSRRLQLTNGAATVAPIHSPSTAPMPSPRIGSRGSAPSGAPPRPLPSRPRERRPHGGFGGGVYGAGTLRGHVPVARVAAARFLCAVIGFRYRLDERVFIAGRRCRAVFGASRFASDQGRASSLDSDTEIETTLKELDGYQIVKAIACGEVKPNRVTHRDATSSLAALLDDNNRKPVARPLQRQAEVPRTAGRGQGRNAALDRGAGRDLRARGWYS